MSLDTALCVERDGFALDIALAVRSGEVVALLGPNGAGKTTTLRAIAGLLALTRGHVDIDGVRYTHAPADRRPVSVVFQDYLLFPHLSALDNVAFGLRARGQRTHDARRQARGWLARMGLAPHADSHPGALSGGQAQRVALARALAVEPRVLLLDEPLAALDAASRAAVRSDLRRHLSGFAGATVLVTHDALDAMVLADRLVILEGGRVVQEGAPAEVAGTPRNDYVARLAGLNLFRGAADGSTVTLSGGVHIVTGSPTQGEVFVAFPPKAVALYRSPPSGSPRNCWPGVVDSVEQHGSAVRVKVKGRLPALADITPAALAELDLVSGSVVWLVVKAVETTVYPA